MKPWSKKHQQALYKLLDMYKHPEKYQNKNKCCHLCASVTRCADCSWFVMTKDKCTYVNPKIITVSSLIRQNSAKYLIYKQEIRNRIKQINRRINKREKAKK